MTRNSHSESQKLTPNLIQRQSAIDGSLLAAALAYRRAGFSLIPVSRRHKVPAGHLLPQIPDPTRRRGRRGTWKPFQKRPPDEATLAYWFASGQHNIALVCGEVSGGLVVLDFDEDAPFHFATWAERVGSLVRRLAVARSSRGFHAYFRCQAPGKNRVLAGTDTGRIYIEARASGGIITAPPSVHKSGAVYRWCQGNHKTVPRLTQSAAALLLEAASSIDERTPKCYRLNSTIPENRPVMTLDEPKMRRLHAYAGTVLRKASLELAMAQGSRNKTLNAVAFRLARYAAVGLLTQAAIENRLLDACGSDGNRLIADDGPSAFWATFQSGYEAGLANPQDLQRLWWRLAQRDNNLMVTTKPVDA